MNDMKERHPTLKVQIENLFESLAMQIDLYADEIKEVVNEQVRKQLYKLDIQKIIEKEAERIAMDYIKQSMRNAIEDLVNQKIIAYKLMLQMQSENSDDKTTN